MPRMERRDWTLLVLAAAQDAPLQPVQLQKALFLLGKRLPQAVGEHYYQFHPYHYGPFNAEVYRDADALETSGLAFVAQGAGWRTYGATPAGIEQAKVLERELMREDGSVSIFIKKLVAWVQSLSFESLVKSIYAEFPEFRAASIFNG